MKILHPVILSGGSGSRLWPMSRTLFPKQLLALTSEHSMLQETLLRLKSFNDAVEPSIVCNQEHRFLIAEQVRSIGVTPKFLMLEPVARNTAAAVASAALHLAQYDPRAVMLVLPADHVISDTPAFCEAVEQAVVAAQAGRLVTFGIQPHYVETGYGYIRRGAALDSPRGAYEVQGFVEKPDQETALRYIESGEYFWNSGMFVFTAEDLLAEMERHCPEVVVACREAITGGYDDLDFFRLDTDAFARCPAVSIDCAVMEKTDQAVIIPVDMKWSDVGSWSALWEASPKDSRGNSISGEVYLHDTHNSYIRSGKRLVAAVGLENMIVVETADAILVASRDHAQDVKKIVEQLQREGRTEQHCHRKVYRPWGSYECIEDGDRFQVKRLIVKPGEQSSMQKHFHRAEHWIVVKGTAEVTIDGVSHLVTENESIYIPQTAEHRIHNPGRIPLHFVEVQSGAYLGEDDIIRTDDNYGRDNES